MDEIIRGLVEDFPTGTKLRKRIYKRIIIAMQNEDWDTEDECRQRDGAYDDALDEVYAEEKAAR